MVRRDDDDPTAHDDDATRLPADEATAAASGTVLGAATRLAEAIGEVVERSRQRDTGSASTIVQTRYQIGAEIGRGGMGLVVAARDEQIGREVALKLIRGSVPSDRTVFRFVREAKIQGQLEHPAIVPVHEIGVGSDGRPFFAMKKLDGTTLAHILETRDPKFPRQRLLRALADVCLAIEFAHTRGYVHRDLKPANIMLGDFGEVYVLDWGVAKSMVGDAPEPEATDESAEHETRAGTAIGTLRYMSPEQLRGERAIDGRSDVFSLGAILFEVLAGERLYDDASKRLLTSSIVDARPSHRAPDRDVPPELDNLCVAATAIDEADRIPTARALGDAIQRFLDGDRDVALRRTLARDHLAAATDAFAAGDTDELRARAMREAGTALALDPTLRPAAELVSRLMLEPPRVTPAEVEAEMAAADASSLRGTARVAAWSYAGYTIFAALLFVLAPAYWPYGATMIGLSAVGSLIAIRGAGTLRLPPVWFVVAGNCVALVVLSRLTSALLITPGIATVTISTLVLSPRFDRRWLVLVASGALVAAVLVPWLAEALGAISETATFAPGTLTLRAPVLASGAFATVLLVFYVISLIWVGSAAVFVTRTRERTARKQIQLQAWQLRQLVPVAG